MKKKSLIIDEKTRKRNKFITKLVNTFFFSFLKDDMSGYRAFNKKFVKNLNILTKGFEIETEISIYALKNNYKIIEIPINIKQRPKGSKSKLNTFVDGFKVLKTIFYFKGQKNEKNT